MKLSRAILYIIIFAAAIAASIVIIVRFTPGIIGSRPFSGLKAADISGAEVTLAGQDGAADVTELEELTEALGAVLVYEKHGADAADDGQGAVFTVTMNDGTKTEIEVRTPFIVIDGVCRNAKREPCERLVDIAARAAG